MGVSGDGRARVLADILRFFCAAAIAASGCARSADPQQLLSDPNIPSSAHTPEDPNGGAKTTLTYHRDIKTVIEAKCNQCHVKGGIGPFTLGSYDEVIAHAKSSAVEVESGRMPPWMPSNSCNRYLDDISLTDQEKADILGWIAGGAPEGSASDAPEVQTAKPGGTSGFRADLTLKMEAPYSLKQQEDEYRCFNLPWTSTTTKYVVGSNFTPGTPSVVHHAIVYIIAPNNVAGLAAKDGADGSPGYPCGQTGPSFDWLASWAPGGSAHTFADGGQVGTRMTPGSGLVMQVHYHFHGDSAAGKTDQSSIALQLADSVEKEGHYVQFMNPFWLLGGMSIKANDPDATASFSANLRDTYSLFAGARPTKPLEVHMVAGHMHQRGSKLSLRVQQAPGSEQCLLDIPAWDFSWQNGYRLAKPYPVGNADEVELSCHWNNTAEKQPIGPDGTQPAPRDLRWGEGTDDEMCMGFLYMSEQ